MVGKGIDVEALSPRDANARRPRTTVAELKTKAAAHIKANKEKEHPPPPPPYVTEPPSADRKDGAVYQVGKLLGKGGFAVCYSGVLAGSKKVYALKIVKSKMPTKMEQKFQTELQIHSKMRHVNIVQFFRAFSFENSTYLVLEMCPNGSLMDMVKRRKGVTEPEVRFYAVQIAGAIKYMHAKGIIHRDLKMGNIFLDKNMNAKIGDFGLAALLVTGRDMQTIRRTTLCGTPNYIAPEILQKGRQGHDHMVDIWSLGIIMFAMLTSKPPFQSSTTDEIYRRAKERDYEWPARDTKFISDEAKHVVASMLQEAHMRPDPDSIIEHPFFTTGYMPTPEDITLRLRDLPPERDVFYRHPCSVRMQEKNLETLKEMCATCNVGPWNSTKLLSKAVWREMAAEEQAGLTPAIPLADNIVYRPFDSWLQENQLRQGASSTRKVAATVVPVSTATAESSTAPSSAAQPSLAEWATNTAAAATTATATVAPGALLRAPPQSFAAQQRAQGRPTRSSAAAAVDPAAEPMATAAPAGLVRRPSAKRDVPLGNGLSLQAREQEAVARTAASATTATVSATTTRAQRTLLPSGKPAATVSERRAALRSTSAGDSAASTAATAATQVITTATTECKSSRTHTHAALSAPVPTSTAPARSATTTATTSTSSPQLTLFSPTERQEHLPDSEPDVVLVRLQRLQGELDRALNARTMAFITGRDSVKAPPKPPQIVVKWVDYTNKFGLGYILNDGSVGCILRTIKVADPSGGDLPPACILIPGAERHIQRRDDLTYADRHQIVPMAREPAGGVYFYENNGESGMHRVRVEPDRFRVAVDPRTGQAGKLSAGKDVYDHRKRERIVLWKKFANYMLAYGRELDETPPPAPLSTATSCSSSSSTATSPPVVTFYQRFGDVGCWVFADGHVQFNFPDHTKIVLDAAGVWCHFWHLPAAAASQLAATGQLDESALDARSVLSYPLQTLLNFGTTSAAAGAAAGTTRRRPVIRPEMQGIPAANDFRHKVEFVRSVVREWVAGGGLGNSDMTREGRLRWLGAREIVKSVPSVSAGGAMTAVAVPPAKHVWVTIGARQGDVRRSAMVDPRRPNEQSADLEDRR